MSTSSLPQTQTQAHLPTQIGKHKHKPTSALGLAEKGWSSEVGPLRWRTQRVVGTGLDFGRRWAVRSGRCWAGLRSAIGAGQQGVVGAGLGFDQRLALRSGWRWAGLRLAIGAGQRGVVGVRMDFDRQSALGSEEWSALGFGATDWAERPIWLKWRTGRGRKRKKEETPEREKEKEKGKIFF